MVFRINNSNKSKLKTQLRKSKKTLSLLVENDFFYLKVLTQDEREKRKTSIYRVPTNEELSELKENEDLYKNNILRMHVIRELFHLYITNFS